MKVFFEKPTIVQILDSQGRSISFVLKVFRPGQSELVRKVQLRPMISEIFSDDFEVEILQQ